MTPGLFLSLSGHSEGFQTIDLSEIIARGDILKRAIFSLDELRQGFRKLTARGLIEINDDQMRFSKIGIEIREKVNNDKGGLFSMVDNALKRINSPGLKLNHVEREWENCFKFLNDHELEKSYNRYIAHSKGKETKTAE